MTKHKTKQIRRTQTLTPFGVGAILDIDGESFVACDISWWDRRGPNEKFIYEDRLARLLGVRYFRTAPPAPDKPWEVKEDTSGVPFRRFPKWLFCPKCRRMEFYYNRETPYCQHCREHPKLVPMRFVMACPRGHMSDVPWVKWAHSQSRTHCEDHSLRFITRSGGSGLEFLSVKCTTCGAERNLKGIASRDSLRALNVRCSGKHPWDPKPDEQNCDAVPQVLQRGATNLTFAKIESSITIPRSDDEDEDLEAIISHPLFNDVKDHYSDGMPSLVQSIIKVIAEQVGTETEAVERAIARELHKTVRSEKSNTISFEGLSSTQRLLIEEYDALLAPDRKHRPKDNFIKRFVETTHYPDPNASTDYRRGVELLKDVIDQIVQVTRMREVRALVGFSRLSPADSVEDESQEAGKFSVYGSDQRKIAPSLVSVEPRSLQFHERWLPAIEVFGEGIFITLDEKRLKKWETKAGVIRRITPLIVKQENTAAYLPTPSPRLVLLHTLAHVLIRQLSFECGYSISSLRERIYCSSPDTGKSMAGILLYTAAGDAEGTLGGLVRQGEPDRLISTMMKALQNAEWCSSDPLCRESTGQGPGALNLAACHACSLLPETSCVLSNKLLDRAMLLGTLDNPDDGYFSQVMSHVAETMHSI